MSFALPTTSGLIWDLYADDVAGDDSGTPIGTYPQATRVATVGNRGSGGDAVQIALGGSWSNPRVWRDEYGTGKHALYFNGVNALRLDGSATTMGEVTATDAFTMMFAVRTDIPNFLQGFLSCYSASEGFQVTWTTALRMAAVPGVLSIETICPTNGGKTVMVVCIRSDGTNHFYSVDDGDETQGGAPGGTGTGTLGQDVILGRYTNDTTNNWTGCLGRFVYYDRDLAATGTDLADVKQAFLDYYPTTEYRRQHVYIGDSLTAGNSGASAHTYPELFRNDHDNSRIVCNLGVSGATAANMLSKWDSCVRQTGPTRSRYPRSAPVIILQGGINDVFAEDPDAAAIFATLRQIPDDFVADNAACPDTYRKFLWCTVTPFRRHASATDAMETARQELNDLIRGYSGAGVTIIDLDPVMESTVTPGYLKDGAGSDPNYADVPGPDDFLHYNQLGQQAVADALAPYLEDDGGGSLAAPASWHPNQIPGCKLFVPTSNLSRLFTDSGKTTNATAAGDQIRAIDALPEPIQVTAPADGNRPFLRTDDSVSSLHFTTSTAVRYVTVTNSAGTFNSFHLEGLGAVLIKVKFEADAALANNFLLDNANLGAGTNQGITLWRNGSEQIVFTMYAAANDIITGGSGVTTTDTIAHTNWADVFVNVRPGTGETCVQIDEGSPKVGTQGTLGTSGDAASAMTIGARSTGVTPTVARMAHIYIGSLAVSEENRLKWSNYNPALGEFEEVPPAGGNQWLGMRLGLGL